jgi:DNA processing protein
MPQPENWDSLVSARERAAALALLARRDRSLPWNKIAGAIEEKGGALTLLRALEADAEDRLFQIDEGGATLDELEDRVHVWEQDGISLITVLDEAYPVNLRMVYDRPPLLFVMGELSAQDERSVAVVGTRSASTDGLDAARRIVFELVAADFVVVSGLAEGIDTAVHTAALEAGGRTEAVIGTGLKHAFPRSNEALQERLARESAVISQFWPDQGPRRWTFPQRNAVMSGFSRATVVVEASHTSGARMQARLAREHGRPVFLLDSLVRKHDWAKIFVERPGVYAVSDGEQIIAHLERLYDGHLALAP